MLSIATVKGQTSEVLSIEENVLAFVYVDIYVESGSIIEVRINDKTFFKRNGDIAGENFSVKIILTKDDKIQVYCDGTANVFVHGFTYQL